MVLVTPLRRSLVVLLGLAVCVALWAPATAAAGTEGSPAITLAASSPANTLIGSSPTIKLEAANPAGQPNGYNLSFRAVLPEHVAFVPGSSALGSGLAVPAPTVIANEPTAGKTTLIWSNVGDLSPASSTSLSFGVTPSSTTIPVGATLKIEAGAYISSQPRFLPKFSATGAPLGPNAESFTGAATTETSTKVTAIEVSQIEESPEGELLRGVHDHQTVYKVKVTNNSVNSTSSVSLGEFLPADLEYLGCGGAGADHTTNAPTNPGSTEEYPGSGPITVASLTGCVTPELVETLETDPDGAGESAKGVYSHLQWSLGTMKAGETRTFAFRAAVPLRENTLSWTGTKPTPASGGQATNLDNNNGRETRDGEQILTYAEATGSYKGETAVSAGEHLSRTAKDLTTEKSAGSATLQDEQLTEWKILVHSSEYRYNTAVRVEDEVPNGLCPLSSTNLTSSSECAPNGDLPSSPYKSASEEANGTWKLVWTEATDGALATLQQNETTTLTYWTRTRSHYQSGHKESTPVLANDMVVNRVTAAATTNVVCANDTDCSGSSKTPIDHERPLSEAVSDGSSASQSAEGPSIVKEIAQSGTNCLSDTYVKTVPVYHPGDLVCWLLEASFPQRLSTHGSNVTDFLPASVLFDEAFNSGTGEAATAADTLPATTFSHSEASSSKAGGAVSWSLPEEGYVGNKGQRFSRVIATNASLLKGAVPGDLQGNLMKFSSINTEGHSFALRDEAEFKLEFPQLSLAKNVIAINKKAFGPAGSAKVKAGDEAEFALTLTNAGEQQAIKTEVWEELPSGVSCAAVSEISGGGSCTAGRISWGDIGLGQAEASVASKGETTLHFVVTVPAAINPSTTLEDHAGVVEYHSTTNTGGEYTYVPAEDIDTTLGLEANMPAALAHAKLETEEAKLEKTHTTAVTESPGNSAAQATIGELVTFEITATLPAGTTFGGEAKITDPAIPTTRLSYEKGSAEALLEGSAAPGEFKTEEVAGSPVLTMPANYSAPGGSARHITLRFKARVANVAGNYAGGSGSENTIPNTAGLGWTNPITGAQSREAKDSVPLVEPSIKLVQTNNSGGPVHGGQLVEYKLELSDASGASGAFDNKILDTLPTNVTATNSSGVALKDGEATASGGIYNAAAHTITWETAKLASAAKASFPFFVTVNESPISATSLTNLALATTSGIEGAGTGERTAANAPTEAIKARYESSSEGKLEVEGATIAKESDSATATIGHRTTYTLTITLPPHVIGFDETAIDTLPDSLDFDQYVGAECTAGCPPETAPTVNFYEPVVEAGATKLAWDLGNLSNTGLSRTVKIRYVADVRATHRSGGKAVEAPSVLENQAALYYNKTEKGGFEASKFPSAAAFDTKKGFVTAKTTVVEPKVTFVKELSLDGGAYSSAKASLTDGDTLAYRLTVTNGGTSPAYDTVVTDHPPGALEAITPTEEAAEVTKNSAGEIAWLIPGPIAPGASVKLGYSAKLVPVKQLKAGQAVNNEANVPAYFGTSEAEREAGLTNFKKEAIAYRKYTGTAAQVTATVALPAISIEKTTGGTGFPASANAEVAQAFPWRVVVKNTSTVPAKHLTLTDHLPANWEYIAKTASFSAGGAIEPTVSGGAETGRELTWSTNIELAPGASTTLTYNARPAFAAEANPGTGEAHANLNSASAAVQDAAGNSEDAEGPFTAGPASARALLQLPGLEVTKVPAKATVKAGEGDSFTITVHNTGSATAREVALADTLPAGMTYKAKAATASPSTGFSETSASASAVAWKIESIAAGTTVKVTVPVGTEPGLPAGTKLKNEVAASSLELSTPVNASATIETETSADLQAGKSIPGGAPTVPGGTLPYKISALNKGPSVAHEVKLTDQLPAGESFLSGPTGCTANAGTVTCTQSELAVGETAAFEFEVTLASSLTGTIENTVLVESATPDPVSPNNTAAVSSKAGPEADLSLRKVTETPEVLDGQPARFLLSAVNAGPSDAQEAVITDILPAGLHYLEASGASCKATGQLVACTLGTLAPGAGAAVEITVSGEAPGVYRNEAEVESPTPDPEPEDNQAHSSLTVKPAAALTLEKTAGSATVEVPGTETYTLTVQNHGPDPATEVLLSDPLPSGLSYVSDDAGCTAAGQNVSCPLGELANGATRTIHLVTAVSPTLATRNVVNRATVSSSTGNPEPVTATSEASFTAGPAADLAIDKSGPAAVQSGGAISWTLRVTNNGPSPALGVSTSDTLPAGAALVGAEPAQGSCQNVLGVLSCQLGSLAVGASTQVTVHATVLAVSGSLTNTATVSGTLADPEPDNNSASVLTRILPAASGVHFSSLSGFPTHVSLHKRASVSRAAPGAHISYRLTIRNTGSETAERLELCDRLPVQTTVLGRGGGHLAHGRICFAVAKLAPHAARAFVIVLRVDSNAQGLIVNHATLKGKGFPTVHAKAITSVHGQAPARLEHGVTG